jgi:microcystin degradation protein MlrC
MWILAAFDRAGLRGCVVGITYDPPNAAAVHAAGVGARIEAHFNTVETNASSKPFTAPRRCAGCAMGA